MDTKIYDVYIYQHVPKCGGRSFIEVCRKHLHKISDSPPPFPTKQQKAEFKKQKKDLSTLPPRTLLHGHLIHRGLRVFERYAAELASGKCAVITIIRDPLERALSEYFHRKKRGLDSGTIPEWLALHSNNICKNLGIEMKDAVPAQDFFLLIGTTERLQESLDVFAGLAGFPSEEMVRINTSPRDAFEISEEVLNKFRAANSDDYALFDYANQKLDTQIAGMKGRRLFLFDAPFKTLLYQELPKCRPRAFVNACSRYFQILPDRISRNSDTTNPEDANESKPRLEGHTKPVLIYGDWGGKGIDPQLRYCLELESKQAGLVTILRDPLERSLAIFQQKQNSGKPWPGGLEDWLGRNKNAMCRLLGIKMRRNLPLADPFLVIGTYDQLEDTLALFVRFAGLKLKKRRLIKVPDAPQIEVSPELSELFRKNNARDYALYEYAKRKLAHQLQSE